MFETAIYTLRLDDKTSSDGVHLTYAQRLSLFETVWENIPYKMLDKLVEEMKKKNKNQKRLKMAEIKLNFTDKAIKDRIIRLINYRLSNIEVDVHMINKGKKTKLREEIIQDREADKGLLEDCLTWISRQQG